MFSEQITHTCFVKEEAIQIFSNISCSENGTYDQTLISTMRGLFCESFGSELPEVNVSIFQYVMKEKMIEAIRNVLSVRENHFMVLMCPEVKGTAKEDFVPKILEACNKYSEEWKFENSVTELFRKSFNAYCFTNEKAKSVLAIIDTEMSHLHEIQCTIVRLMPWYFDVKALTENQIKLIYSLREKDPRVYKNVLKEIYYKIDFRSMIIKKSLEGFETILERGRLKQINEELSYLRSEIESYHTRIASLLSQCREKEAMQFGLRNKIDECEDDKELMNYFLANKKLNIHKMRRNRIYYSVSDYLMYFDENLAETVINNPRSMLYGRSRNISDDDLHTLLNAIFIDRIIKIRTCAAFRLDLEEINIGPVSNYDWASIDMSGRLPNPHIDEYSCIEGYIPLIDECLESCNYIGAIEQTVASTKNLNFGDVTVLSKFIDNLDPIHGIHEEFFELPDGRTVYVEEAIEYAKGALA